MKEGRVFVVAGPSGAGKTTLIKKALDRVKDIHFSVSATTRDRRKGDVEGKDYYFVTDPEFDELIARDALFEWEEVYGRRYGTLKNEVEKAVASGRDVLLELDVKGALNVKKQIRGATLIFIQPPSLKDLEKRLESRGRDNEADIKSRTGTAPWEMSTGEGGFDVYLVNEDVDKTAVELAGILRGETT